MPTVCNNIIPQLVVSTPGTCAQFSENQSYSAACGSGTATDSCALSISGGVAPYNTTFSYPVVPTTSNCTLNMSAFPGGSGSSPQFGYSFTGSNMCSLSISGNLQVNYTVTDSSGQVVTGSLTFPVSITRYVTFSGGGGGGCVAATSYVTSTKTAGETVVGDILFGMTDDLVFQPMEVRSNRPEYQDSVRITMTTGATLVVSKSTPLTLRDGGLMMVADLTPGIELPVRYEDHAEFSDEPFWDTVASVDDVGMIEVQVVNIGGYSYAAGEKPGAFIYTHNAAEQKL